MTGGVLVKCAEPIKLTLIFHSFISYFNEFMVFMMSRKWVERYLYKGTKPGHFHLIYFKNSSETNTRIRVRKKEENQSNNV